MEKNQTLEHIEALEAENKRLRTEVYIPGMWYCAKCKFTLLQSNLNAQDGTVTARDQPGDKCPNCNKPLWRRTWKQDAFEMQERAVEQMERAKEAERLLGEAMKVLKPFSEAAVDLDDNNPDCMEIWEAPCAMQITAGHLRAALRFMESQEHEQRVTSPTPSSTIL